jgi:signal transduction histidine kinase
VDPLATLKAAAAAVYALAAFTFGVAYARRQVDREYGVFALMCLALTSHAAAALIKTDPLTADMLGLIGLIVAFTTLAHFGMMYRGITATRRVLFPIYAIAALFVICDARGLLHEAADPTRVARIGPLGVVMYALGCAAVAAVLVLVARAYLAGKREALAVVVGTTVLLATMINDVGVASGAFTTAPLADAGFIALVFGVSTTYSARYAFVTKELERKSKELRTRTRELRRSYEELRAAQEELVRKEQLAVVGELAAVIAHEVRNPLAIIANAVSGLRKATISRSDQETLLTILDEETSRLNRLVTDLLRYARPVNLQRQHIPLAELLDRSLTLLKQRKPVNVEFKVEATEARIWGDSNLLRQVFDNLIDNAVQAMGHTGTLTVRVRPMTDEGADGLAVDIIDTGEGMDTQVRSRARDPFFTTRPSGTGLGLAIVDRIVDAHGGRFLIESRAGEGTTVTVFLPYGSSSEPPPKPRKKGTSEPPPRPPLPDASSPDVAAVSVPQRKEN